MQNKFHLELDDFGLLMPGLDDLLRIKQHYPDFKMTCFTVPFPKEFFYKPNQKHFSREKYRKWAEIVNSYDWIQVAMHGFGHSHFEFDCTYEKADTMLKAAENLWDEVGLKYVKIFRAPYWQYSYDAIHALKDRGYVVAIDRNNPRPVPPGTKVYIYNWSFEEPLPGDPIIKGHGHFTGRNKNNINDTLGNILHHLPRNSEFIFISEYLEKYEERRK